MQHQDPEIRQQAIAVLANALKLRTTPIQFLALFALSATDPADANRIEAQKQLDFAINYRHQILEKLKTSNSAITPESAIPFLMHLLTHHPNFEEDLPELSTFVVYLNFFFKPLCARTTDFGTILNILLHLSLLEDIENCTGNLVKLCDLGSAIVKELGSGRSWDFTEDKDFEYSSRYFKESGGKERLQELLKRKDERRSPILHQKPILTAGMSPGSKSPRLKKVGSNEEGGKAKKGKSAPITPVRRSPRMETREKGTEGTKKQKRKRTGSPTMLDGVID
jgi:hypothetical protein